MNLLQTVLKCQPRKTPSLQKECLRVTWENKTLENTEYPVYLGDSGLDIVFQRAYKETEQKLQLETAYYKSL